MGGHLHSSHPQGVYLEKTSDSSSGCDALCKPVGSDHLCVRVKRMCRANKALLDPLSDNKVGFRCNGRDCCLHCSS